MRRAEFTPPPRPTEWGQAYRIQFWSSVAPARWYEPARPKLNSVSLTPGPKPSTEPMTAATARKKCRNPVWCWCPAVVIPRFPTKNTGTCGPRQAETSAKWASSPPRCSPAWSGVQHQRRPRNRPLRHHAARQRGAVFKTREVREIRPFATTLLASVERCSRPETSAKSAPSPPRCSPAWSGVQHQRRPRNGLLRHYAARQRGAVFNTRDVREIGPFATTLLASVERCSRCWTQWWGEVWC